MNVSVKYFSKLCFGTIKIQPELKPVIRVTQIIQYLFYFHMLHDSAYDAGGSAGSSCARDRSTGKRGACDQGTYM